MFSLLLLLLAVSSATAYKLGVVTSDTFNTSDILCLESNNVSAHLYWRGYLSTGVVDKVGIANLIKAIDLDMKDTTVYMNPNPSGDPIKQAEELCSYIGTQTDKYRFRILVRLMRGDRWASDAGKNRAFVLNLTKTIISQQEGCFAVGFYTSKADFNAIFGDDFTALSGRYLSIYAEHDRNPELRNFKSFGGWERPRNKEFLVDSTKYCGKRVNVIASVPSSSSTEEDSVLMMSVKKH